MWWENAGKRFCGQMADLLGVNREIFRLAFEEIGIQSSDFKIFSKRGLSVTEALDQMLPAFEIGFKQRRVRIGPNAYDTDIAIAIELWRHRDTTDRMQELAYIYAHDVLNVCDIVKGLAQIHLHELTHQIDGNKCDALIQRRDIVEGTYRTVGIGGALAVRYMQGRGCVDDDILVHTYYDFVQSSAIRKIADDISSSLTPGEGFIPRFIFDRQRGFLMSVGFEIGSLYSQRRLREAFNYWREAMITSSEDAESERYAV